MSRVKCSSCGAEFETSYSACPACGLRRAKTFSPLPLMIIGIVVAAVLLIVFGGGAMTEKRARAERERASMMDPQARPDGSSKRQSDATSRQ